MAKTYLDNFVNINNETIHIYMYVNIYIYIYMFAYIQHLDRFIIEKYKMYLNETDVYRPGKI